jgi:hypothetical protein
MKIRQDEERVQLKILIQDLESTNPLPLFNFYSLDSKIIEVPGLSLVKLLLAWPSL